MTSAIAFPLKLSINTTVNQTIDHTGLALIMKVNAPIPIRRALYQFRTNWAR